MKMEATESGGSVSSSWITEPEPRLARLETRFLVSPKDLEPSPPARRNLGKVESLALRWAYRVSSGRFPGNGPTYRFVA